jgi:hypothetical protein
MSTVLAANLPNDAEQGLARLNLAEVGRELWVGAAEDFVQSEIANRAAERREVLEFPAAFAERAREDEETNNESGLARSGRIREEVQRARESWRQPQFREIHEATRRPEFQERLSQRRQDFFRELDKQDLPAGDVREIRQGWMRAEQAARQNGLDGLGESLQEAVDRLDEARSSPSRGREPHSPLPTWKYWLIAGAIVVGIAAVVACFWWWGCSWILNFLKWAAPQVYSIVQNGC